MPNSLDAFTTARIDYGKELLSFLRQNAFLSQTVSRKFSPGGVPRGGTVYVPDLSSIPAVVKRPKHGQLTFGDMAANYIPVPLDQEANVPMVLDSIDAVISDIDWRQKAAQKAAIAIIEAMEADLAALYFAIPNVVGAAASAAFSDTAKAIAAVTALDTQKAPLGLTRYGALSPAAKGSALGNASFTSYNNAGPAGATNLIAGSLGERFGITWGLAHAIPKHRTADGTSDWGTPAVDNAGGYPIGTKTIHIDGLAASGALKKGDAFTLKGYNYSLAADATATTGECDITIAQDSGLRAAVVQDDPITISAEGVKTGYQNLVYLEEAFALATSPLDDERPGTQSDIIRDDQTGLAIRVTYAYNLSYKRHEFVTELLYGVKLVRGDYAVRMVASG